MAFNSAQHTFTFTLTVRQFLEYLLQLCHLHHFRLPVNKTPYIDITELEFGRLSRLFLLTLSL